MKQVKMASILIFTVLTTACSYGYNIIIVNDSKNPIEVRYKTSTNDPFDVPMMKSVEDIKAQESITRFWTEAKPWLKLAENQFETVLAERIIKILPNQAVQIERGTYNPSRGDREGLTRISELRIISSDGEISYKGKLILNEFEMDDYTFVKTLR